MELKAMTSHEAKLQQDRLAKYQPLERERAASYRLLEQIRNGGPKVCTSGPFTGNWRESRRVIGLTIDFSRTMGGAPAVQMDLTGFLGEAWKLGQFLETQLNERIKAIEAEMEKI